MKRFIFALQLLLSLNYFIGGYAIAQGPNSSGGRASPFDIESNERVWQEYLDDRDAIDRKIDSNTTSAETARRAYDIAIAAIYLGAPDYREQAFRAIRKANSINNDQLRAFIFTKTLGGLLDIGAIEDALEMKQELEKATTKRPGAFEYIPEWKIETARAVGDYQEEEAALSQIFPLLEKYKKLGWPNKSPAMVSMSIQLARLGNAQAMQGKFEEARKTVETALPLGTDIVFQKAPGRDITEAQLAGKDQLLFHRYQQLAETSFLYSDYDRANELIDEALKLGDRKWITNMDQFWRIYALGGQISFKKGNAKESIDRWENAISESLLLNEVTSFQRSMSHPAVIWAREGLAWARLLAEDERAESEALAIHEARQEHVERLFRFASQRQRLTYLQSVDPFSLLAETGQSFALAESLLRFKGSVLDSVLEDLRLARNADSPELAEIGRQLRVAKRVAFDSAWKGDKNSVDHQTEVQRLEAKLGSATNESKGSKSALDVTVEDVQGRLSPDDRLCEFFRYQKLNTGGATEPWYGVVVLSPTGMPEWTPLGRALPIDDAILLLKQAMSHENDISEADLIALLANLYESLLQPIEQLVPDGGRMIVSPDSNLSCLSFAVLMDDQQQFAASRWKISYVSTGRDLLEESIAPKREMNLAVFADPTFAFNAERQESPSQLRALLLPFELDFAEIPPLPGTRKELNQLEMLSEQFGWNLMAYAGEDATENVLQNWESAPDVLHFATHGLFLKKHNSVNAASSSSSPQPNASGRFDNPLLRSLLTLTGAQSTFEKWENETRPDPSNDGILTAEEVSQIDLQGTWLATLSACDTASGETLEGEGVLGLRRGFFLAGVDHLLMTFWPIADEETVEIISAFYGALPEYQHPGLALASVQAEALERIRGKSGVRFAVMFAGPFAASGTGPLPGR